MRVLRRRVFDSDSPARHAHPAAQRRRLRSGVGAPATETSSLRKHPTPQNGSRYFYIWGTGGYADVFDPAGLVHEITFCYQITNVLGDPANPRTAKNPNGTDVQYTLFMHSEYNSAR